MTASRTRTASSTVPSAMVPGVQEWSEDEDGNLVYYLNAGSYQVDPTDSENSWYLSDDMVAGYSHAKFAAEEFELPIPASTATTTWTAAPWRGVPTHSQAGHWLAASSVSTSTVTRAASDSPERTTTSTGTSSTRPTSRASAQPSRVRSGNFDGSSDKLTWEEEMVLALGAVKDSNGDGVLDDGDARFEHKIEGNMWRPIDNTISGIDGWMEVHSSWVRLKTGQTVAPGETVAGDFQIFFEGSEAGSRLLVRGAFEITELDMDRWGYDILEDVKREENGTPYCGGAKAPQ